MTMRQPAPYGTWDSPISPEMLTQGAVGLVDVWADGDHVYWLESRPSQGGRLQIVRRDETGARCDVLPEGFSARSGVHEYGGGAAWVAGGVVWFCNWDDQRLYRLGADGLPVALTAPPSVPRSRRYADMRQHPNGQWLVCVMEHHDGADVTNNVVVLAADKPSEPKFVDQRTSGGADFVMSPRFVADDRIRWIAWDHPNMPWDETRLMEASFDPVTGSVGAAVTVTAGGSLMQPDGDLVISDRNGWWQIWSAPRTGRVQRVGADIGGSEMSGPAWVFGERDYVVAGDGTVAFAVGSTVYANGNATPTDVAALDHWSLVGTTVTAIARYATHDAQIVRFDLAAPAAMEVLAAARELPIGPDDISRPVEVSFATAGGVDAYAWFYPPTNAHSVGMPGTAPPLVVMIHGGPTSNAEPLFSLAKQFWTSRGFAVADINHRGSTGFGTAFRRLLNGQWGVVDVEDCCSAALHLANEGMVDPQRMVIRGGSAGGFTVLSCLATQSVFAAGASLYGIADLGVLAEDTHKFEARYCDGLIGPWPQARDVYDARSPIRHLDGFDCPLIVFQGLDDMVVPPNQAEMIVAALHAAGVECEYHAYEGEGHGFRRAETIVHQLAAELAFYQRVLGLRPTSTASSA